MSYIEFFEFKEHPFRITPDVAFFYSSPTHLEALQSLKYFAESDEGFLVLIGEPGTGKTITLRKFMNEVSENVEYAYVLFPSLEPEDMFRVVLEDFGYKINSKVSKNTLFSGFRDFLMQKKAQGKKLFLVIDEAQNLPVRTLEELRILSNLETEKEKLIQFIISGQPELDKKLSSDELRQLKQRISINIRLEYMNPYEMAKYVAFRLAKGGFQGQYPDASFYDLVYSLTKGNPRLVNLLMERSLMAAYVDQSKSMTTKHLENAAISLKLKPGRPMAKIYAAAGAAVVTLGILGGALYYNTKMNTPKWDEQPIVQQQPLPQPVQKAAEKPVQQAAEQPIRQTVQEPAQEQTPAQAATQTTQEPVQQQAAPGNQEAKNSRAAGDIQIIDVRTARKSPPAEVKKETVKPAQETKPEPEPQKTEEIQQEDAKSQQTVMKVGLSGYITANILNIRSGPDINYTVITKLVKGDRVTILSFYGDWFQVSFNPRDGVNKGWVHRDYVIPAR